MFLNIIKKIRRIVSELKECNDYYSITDIVHKSVIPFKATFQEFNDEISFPYYVIQSSGYFGDDFSGTMWIKLWWNWYLVVDYRC